MKNNLMSGTFKVTITTAVLHFLSAATALTFFVLMRSAAATVMEALPLLFIVAIILAFLAIAGIFIFVLQTLGGIGIIITVMQQKQKLCTIICGLLIVVDFITAFCSAILGFSIFIIGELDAVIIFCAIDLLLLAVLSVVSAILSIVAIVKNLSDKSDSPAQ